MPSHQKIETVLDCLLILIKYSLKLRMNLHKDTKHLPRSKVDPAGCSSKPKPTTLSSEKENRVLDYIYKEKIRAKIKNQTASIVARLRKEDNVMDPSEVVARKKFVLKNTLVCKQSDANGRARFNLTLGNKQQQVGKQDETRDVSSAIRSLRNQMKISTMGGNLKRENMLTEDDIDKLFEGTSQSKVPQNNIPLQKIKHFLETQPDQKSVLQQNLSVPQKDFADSIKYLELEDGPDRLLSSLKEVSLTTKDDEDEGVDKTTKFKQQFIVGKQIGQGAYASVRVALSNILKKKVAIKIYEKRKIKEPQRKKSVRREIKILQRADHKNIVKILDVIETNNHINLIMEYLPGVCLSTYLKAQADGKLAQRQAKSLLRGLVEAVKYLHRQNICHRDIKLQNIILDNQLSPKLIDFGFATCIDNNKKSKMFCGTPSFMAPEIVTKQEYRGPPTDIWALGVVLYVSLTGTFPFRAQTDKELYHKICNANFPSINHLSKEAVDLINRMLTVNVEQRITASEILGHEWMASSYLIERRAASVLQSQKNIDQVEARLKRRAEESKEKKKFALTQSSNKLKQMLRKVNQHNVSPRLQINIQDNLYNSKPATPKQALSRSSRARGETELGKVVPPAKLTNKIYF